ncbi:MAG: hypothetical protein PHE84_10005 [bacterium]|nr:hypothetical protein [bacterium]
MIFNRFSDFSKFKNKSFLLSFIIGILFPVVFPAHSNAYSVLKKYEKTNLNVYSFLPYTLTADYPSAITSEQNKKNMPSGYNLNQEKIRPMNYYFPLIWDFSPIALTVIWGQICSHESGPDPSNLCSTSAILPFLFINAFWPIPADGYTNASGLKMGISFSLRFLLVLAGAIGVEVGESLHGFGCEMCDTDSCRESCASEHEDRLNPNAYIPYLIVFQILEAIYHSNKVYTNNEEYKERQLEKRSQLIPYIFKDQIGLAFQARF